MRFHFTKKPTPCSLVLAICFGLLSVLSAQDGKPKSSLAEKELQKRRAAVEEAQMLLQKGDEAYLAGNFKDSINAYAGASVSFPDSPTTNELKQAALDRYAQASVEHARELSRKGQVEEAKKILDVVLAADVNPNHAGALTARAELDDPIRTNPALTGEHAKNVDQVRRFLYMADGAFDLGKFDESHQHYTAILKIDPYNEAARRGLERVANQKSKYFKAAYDHTRAEALMQVAREWELPLPSNLVIPEMPVVTDTAAVNSNIPLGNKLSRIIIPKFIVEDVNLMEAIDVLRARAAANDNLEIDPQHKGLNISINLGDPNLSSTKEILSKKFDLKLSNVPVENILKYITEMTQTSFLYDDYAVVITHKGAAGGSLISRTYRVPPDFISNLSAGASQKAVEDDVFNTNNNVNSSLATRMGAQEAFAQQGVSFPEGASLTYNPSNNSLLVVNTLSNHDIIQQIIDLVVKTEPVIISVKVTMVKVEKNILEELGFDWMLNDFSLGGTSGIVPAAGHLTGGTVGNGTVIDDFPTVGGVDPAVNPITAGNRSGDVAFSRFTLDQFLASGTDRAAQMQERAPGVVGLSGVVNNTTIQMLMRGLDQKKAADILATPSITTRSGQAASITMVKEFIYPTEYEPPEIPQSIGGGVSSVPIVPSFPTTYETRDTGVFLEVLPTADENRRYIDIALKPVFTDFDGFVNYGSPINSVIDGNEVEIAQNFILQPVFSAKRVDTNVVIQDGATIVIGGLLNESVTRVNDKTPILGDIPLVGRLFESSGVKRQSIALLFFLNVELVDPTGRPYRER